MNLTPVHKFLTLSFALVLFLGFSPTYNSDDHNLSLILGQQAQAAPPEDVWGMASFFWYSIEETISNEDNSCIAEAESTVIGNTCTFWVSYCSPTIAIGAPQQTGPWICFDGVE